MFHRFMHGSAATLGLVLSGLIPAEDRFTFAVRLEAGVEERVVVVGDGDSNLDLYVYDATGKLLVLDAGRGSFCSVSWVPAQTIDGSIVIVNRGPMTASYRLVVD